MKRFSLSILISLIFVICVSAHDMSRDVFSYNDADSTCTLITTYGTEPGRGQPSRPIARSYGEYVNGYKFIAVGKGTSDSDYLGGTSSIDLPASIQYINAYSLSEISLVTLPKENNLKYIGEYALCKIPFCNCYIYINKDCNFHEKAFVLSPWSSYISAQLHGNNIEIDPENPYWGLEDGMLFQKDSVNIVRYFVHKENGDTLVIPKRFTTINQITTCDREAEENICFKDVSTLKKLHIANCKIVNNEKAWSLNAMDSVHFYCSQCVFSNVKKFVFPNAKYISELNFGDKRPDRALRNLTLLNVEEITNESGLIFSQYADTLSIFPSKILGTRLFHGAYIGRLNWLNEDIPFAESMDEYANKIDVLNLGNAKSVGIKGLMYSLKYRNRDESILLSTATPPEVQSVVLYDDYPSKVTLYVPTGSGEVYRNHEKWGVIPNIIEYDVNGPDPTSAVNNIKSDKSQAEVDVYNLQGGRMRKGVKRSEATQGLPQGIYIINGEKVLVK